MPGPTFVVEGLDELRRAIRQVQDTGLRQSLTDTNRRLARTIVDRALPFVPVRTGRLKASVRGLGNQRGAIGKAGGARVPYAPAIHWGRSAGNINFRTGRASRGQGRIDGRPFLWQAAQSVEREVVDEYQDDLNRILDAAVRNR